MALAAAQVVDAVVALLVPVGLSGGRVYPSRAWPLPEGNLPAWKVFGGDEAIDFATISDIEEHRLLIDAHGFVSVTADPDDAMNNLAAAGLTALFAGTPPHNLKCNGITRQVTTEGEAKVGVITLRLETTFFTRQSAPEIIL